MLNDILDWEPLLLAHFYAASDSRFASGFLAASLNALTLNITALIVGILLEALDFLVKLNKKYLNHFIHLIFLRFERNLEFFASDEKMFSFILKKFTSFKKLTHKCTKAKFHKLNLSPVLKIQRISE